MNLQNIKLPEQPTSAHLTQLLVMLVIKKQQWFTLPDAVEQVAETAGRHHINVESEVQQALSQMDCIMRKNRLMKKVFDPNDPQTETMTPSFCRDCHFNQNGTTGCVSLMAHQMEQRELRAVSKERR